MIPVIDISPLFDIATGDEETQRKEERLQAKKKIALKLHDACTNTGFFYVKNHGIKIDKILSRSKQFFEDLSYEEKIEVDAVKNPMFRGYISEKAGLHKCSDFTDSTDEAKCEKPLEGKKDKKESFTVGANAAINRYEHKERQEKICPKTEQKSENEVSEVTDPIKASKMLGQNSWPDETTLSNQNPPKPQIVGFRADVESYWWEMLQLSRVIAKGLAISLGLDETFFDSALTNPCAQMVMLRYNMDDEDEKEKKSGKQETEGAKLEKEGGKDMGCGAHTDCGFLTILAQDSIGGLEVQQTNGVWVAAPPIDGTFVVNLGDMMQRWSNDRYKSTWHRVSLSPTSSSSSSSPGKRARFSVPFFCNCNYDTPIDCQKLFSEQNNDKKPESKYDNISAGDYIVEKLGLMRK